MKQSSTIFILLCLFIISINYHANAQKIKSERNYIKCTFAEGDIILPYRAIATISKHSYVVDGVGKVSEVTISTTGRALGRIYVIEQQGHSSPGGYFDGSVQRGKDLVDKYAEKATGVAPIQTAETQVMKNYPSTTHAHTIEFRLPDNATLDKFHEDISRLYEKYLKEGKGETSESGGESGSGSSG